MSWVRRQDLNSDLSIVNTESEINDPACLETAENPSLASKWVIYR